MRILHSCRKRQKQFSVGTIRAAQKGQKILWEDQGGVWNPLEVGTEPGYKTLLVGLSKKMKRESVQTKGRVWANA